MCILEVTLQNGTFHPQEVGISNTHALFVHFSHDTQQVCVSKGKNEKHYNRFLLWVMPKEWRTPEVSGPSPWAGNYFVNS